MTAETSRFLPLSQEILRQGCRLRCPTRGESMLPLVPSGAVLEVEPVRAEDLRVGDVPLYYAAGGILVAHRLVAKELRHTGFTLTTRGDALPRNAGERIEPEQILGRVVCVDWGRGRRFRLHAGLGRLLGLVLGRTGFLLVWAYFALRKVKGKYPWWFRWLPGIKPQAAMTAPGSLAINCEIPRDRGRLALGTGPAPGYPRKISPGDGQQP